MFAKHKTYDFVPPHGACFQIPSSMTTQPTIMSNHLPPRFIWNSALCSNVRDAQNSLQMRAPLQFAAVFDGLASDLWTSSVYCFPQWTLDWKRESQNQSSFSTVFEQCSRKVFASRKTWAQIRSVSLAGLNRLPVYKLILRLKQSMARWKLVCPRSRRCYGQWKDIHYRRIADDLLSHVNSNFYYKSPFLYRCFKFTFSNYHKHLFSPREIVKLDLNAADSCGSAI
jgi:hypothetical protein